MTTAELRTLVYDLTGRPSTYARLTSAQVDSYVREGMFDLAVQTFTPSLLDVSTFSTVNGTSTYSLAGNPLRVASMSLGGLTLKDTNISRLIVESPGFNSASTGSPTHWFLIGRGTSGESKVRLWPTPNATLTVTVVSLRAPAALPGSGQILEWDEFEQYALAYYAAWRHLSCKTEIDGDQSRNEYLSRYSTMADTIRRGYSLNSFGSKISSDEREARQ